MQTATQRRREEKEASAAILVQKSINRTGGIKYQTNFGPHVGRATRFISNSRHMTMQYRRDLV